MSAAIALAPESERHAPHTHPHRSWAEHCAPSRRAHRRIHRSDQNLRHQTNLRQKRSETLLPHRQGQRRELRREQSSHLPRCEHLDQHFKQPIQLQRTIGHIANAAPPCSWARAVSSSNRAFHSVPSAFTVSGLMPLRIISLVLRFEVTRAITQSKNLRAHYARGCGSRSLHCPHMLDSRAQSMSPAVRPSFEVTTSGGLTGMRQRVPGADTGRPAAKKVTQCHRCRCSPAAAAPKRRRQHAQQTQAALSLSQGVLDEGR